MLQVRSKESGVRGADRSASERFPVGHKDRAFKDEMVF